MTRLKSWIDTANLAETPFPVENLPLGVFSVSDQPPRQGVAIGTKIVDMQALSGLISFHEHRLAASLSTELFQHSDWNRFMAAGPVCWRAFRAVLTELLTVEKYQPSVTSTLIDAQNASLHLPWTVTEFTDFYAGYHHAKNVGTMFRGSENALPTNWLHMPIGYNGRASSVQVSNRPVRRPWGQVKLSDQEFPIWQPSERFDIELEIGAIVGTPSTGPLSVEKADANIFGFVLLNDWSARDIQSWEYQPLGPFQSKATATTISPWIVMKDALAPFRCRTPLPQVPLLPHLQEPHPTAYDIDLEIHLKVDGAHSECISRTNTRELYYSAAQQLAHHSSAGCPMRVGDLLGSGTISGAERDTRGSFLEMSWGGCEPLALACGQKRAFVQDGDTVTLLGRAQGEGYQVGFGPCSAKVLPALTKPFEGD